ncbi:MAG: hypothetical protein Q4F13_06825 [Pseudomonadota bacterium]|nr:hypothetical protein [Pseudomonadota bacterium]
MGRDRFAMRKLGQGYASPLTRAGCHNCQHSAPVQGCTEGGLQCRSGGFLVARMGICNRYAARLPGAQSGKGAS